MKLTVLGSGTPEAYVRRASSGYLLEIGGERLLLDCGGGIVDRLLQAGYRPSDIDYLFFSHLHSDHMMDYARLVHAAWDEGGTPLRVIGPPPIGEITSKLFDQDGVFAADLRARTELPASQQVWLARGGTLPRPWPAPEITKVQPGFVHEGDGWTVQSCDVPHAQPALICMALAITDGTRKFIYSGDAAICPALEDLCADADFLLHWCFRLDGEEMHPAMVPLTPTPSDIASMAERCNVKRLALTHIRRHMDEPGKHESAHAAMKAVFSGSSEITEDLTIYEI
ncbi:MAG: MBL fold metallo-hydrolase [Geminicoccaceae bacterium]